MLPPRIKEHHLQHPTTTSPSPSFAQLFSAYKKENPKDKIRLSEFAEELETVRLEEGENSDEVYSSHATPPPPVLPESSKPVPDSIPPLPPPPPAPPSASLPRLPPPSPVLHHAIAATPAIRAEQPIKAEEPDNAVSEHKTPTTNPPPTISIFAEFARAYTDIQPRGSFAAKETTRQKSATTPKINVLGWSL